MVHVLVLVQYNHWNLTQHSQVCQDNFLMETNYLKEERETTNLVELFYSADQVRVAGGVLKVHVIWKKKQQGKS